mgnify:CR=1 FL=1
MDTIVKYELKKTNKKELYEQALKEKDDLEKALKEISWKDFLKKDIENTKELLDALEEAYSFEDEVVIEQFIKGREFSVGVIEGKALPGIESADDK